MGNLIDADTTPVAQAPDHLVSEAAAFLILSVWIPGNRRWVSRILPAPFQ